MNQLESSRELPSERGILETATQVLADTAGWAVRLATLPVLPVPQTLRQSAFDSARLGLDTMALLPKAVVYTLERMMHELDDMETRTSRREDLGRRFKREQRSRNLR